MGGKHSTHGTHTRHSHDLHNQHLPPPSSSSSSSSTTTCDTSSNSNTPIHHNPILSSSSSSSSSFSFSNTSAPPFLVLPPQSPQVSADVHFQSRDGFPRSSVPGGWSPPHPAPRDSPAPPPANVKHNQAKKIKNYVNLHKDSLRVFVDHMDFDAHLVSFSFDALVDGSFTIFYFAKEDANCTFMPVYPEIYMPRLIPFKKGLSQNFSQPSGTGIDLGFFELDQLSNPSPKEDIFPLVIYAEASVPISSTDTESVQALPTVSLQAQITQAVLKKNNGGHFQAKVIKQILWVDSIRYELREIYGIDNSAGAEFDNNDPGKECTICMTDPMDTMCLPCRHMCLCSECAKELRLQSNNCPICRQPIEELLEYKINEGANSFPR